MFKLKEASKIYSRGRETVKAINDIGLSIDKGEYVAIVGPSGSGKTTLMNLLGLLDTPTEGNLFVNERSVIELKASELTRMRRETVGFVFQQFMLVPTMTVLQNVMLPLYFAKEKDLENRASSILEKVGLGKRLKHLPSQLSGGEMQRTAIARALVNKPHCLLADEPTGNLDTETAKDVYDIFKEVNEQGTTVIMVTHNREIASSFGRLISIKDGRIESDEKR